MEADLSRSSACRAATLLPEVVTAIQSARTSMLCGSLSSGDRSTSAISISSCAPPNSLLIPLPSPLHLRMSGLVHCTCQALQIGNLTCGSVHLAPSPTLTGACLGAASQGPGKHAHGIWLALNMQRKHEHVTGSIKRVRPQPGAS